MLRAMGEVVATRILGEHGVGIVAIGLSAGRCATSTTGS
jgi:hypothetical protein